MTGAKWSCAAILAAACIAGLAARPGQAADAIERMPPALETRFALSALPPALRDKATVHLLDPASGYRLSRQGTSGITCIVQRTVWELASFRDDIYIPLCYDAAGTRSYLKVIMDAAMLRARGMGPAELKAEIEGRYRSGIYGVPDRPGLSYMVGPVMRTIGPPDLEVHTMAMPHVMFYAPHVSNEDIGAEPDLAVHETLRYPFIDRQGIPEQSYVIQLIGDAEKARILAGERALLDDLCAYRGVLCLEQRPH